MKMKQPEDYMELEVMRAFVSRKSDQEIGMPDVEQELARLKARSKDSASASEQHAGISLRKIAAILVAVLMLTGFGYAAVRTSFFTQAWDEDKAQVTDVTTIDAEPTESIVYTPEIKMVGDSVVLFKDFRLDSIMMQIDQHYQVTTRFADESIKGIHMLLKWNPKQPLDEVLNLLNGFERLKVYREKDELIIENP